MAQVCQQLEEHRQFLVSADRLRRQEGWHRLYREEQTEQGAIVTPGAARVL